MIQNAIAVMWFSLSQSDSRTDAAQFTVCFVFGPPDGGAALESVNVPPPKKKPAAHEHFRVNSVVALRRKDGAF